MLVLDGHFRCLLLDQSFSRSLNCVRRTRQTRFGRWPAFRQRETEALREQLGTLALGRRLVVSCGGGVVETPENRSMLAQRGKERLSACVDLPDGLPQSGSTPVSGEVGFDRLDGPTQPYNRSFCGLACKGICVNDYSSALSVGLYGW